MEQWMEEIYERGNPRQRLTALGQLFWMRYAEYPAAQAIPQLRQFLAADPQDYGARVGIARWLVEDKQYGTAVQILKECIAQRPDDITPRAILVGYALAQGDWKMAQQFLDGVPEPVQDAKYWALRGEYLQTVEGRGAEAIACFEKVLAKRPDLWSARHRLSQCLQALGQTERAQREREIGDRTAHALLDTRVERLLQEVLPNLESRPQGCEEVAQLYDEVGVPREAERWRKLGEELLTAAPH